MRVKLKRVVVSLVIFYLTGILVLIRQWNEPDSPHFHVQRKFIRNSKPDQTLVVYTIPNSSVLVRPSMKTSLPENREDPIDLLPRNIKMKPNVPGSAECQPKLAVGIRTPASKEDTWQTVTSSRLYVFSAFGDKERGSGGTVRVLGTSERSVSVAFCQLWTEGNLITTANAAITKIQEHKGKRFSAAYFTCSLPNNLKPFAVALTTQRCATPTNLIPIQYPEAEKWNFTVCVTPLNYRYSKAYELVEMIELNRILGASNFVFYNYSTGANVDRVLEYYRKQGVVEVIPWHLPMNVDVWPKKPHHRVEIHYFGQLASHNDCLYRNRFRSKYLVYTDLDEFIVPYISTNWNDLIRAIGNRSAYFFRNVFFRKDFQDNTTKYDGLNLAKSFRAITLTNFIREERVFSPRHRSKYIINPKLIETVGIHNIWREKRGGRGQASVPPEMALLHHYRDWENPHEKIKKKIEKRILFFKDKLLQKLQQTWSNLKNVSLA